MQNTLSLFDEIIEEPKISAPKTVNRKREKVVLDRRAIWGEGGFLETVEDNETSIHTTESYTENATIERLERALGMVPLVRNGEWVKSDWFHAYRVTQPLTGTCVFGKRGSMLRDCYRIIVTEGATKALEESFDDTGSWLPKWAYWLFTYRLSIADENEDPHALLKAFSEVITQQDFLDASRKGESLRRITKRLHMQEVRKAARAAKANLDTNDCNNDAEPLQLMSA